MQSPHSESGCDALESPLQTDRFCHASQVIANLIVALGLVVFIGWAFNLPALTYLQPTFEAMRVNTALSFVLLGASVWLIQKDSWRRSRRVLALLVVILAALTLAEAAVAALAKEASSGAVNCATCIFEAPAKLASNVHKAPTGLPGNCDWVELNIGRVTSIMS